MLTEPLREALTFDDVSLLPAASSVLPKDVDVSAELCRGVKLNIPLLSAAMDTVSEAKTAIALAREGGIAVLHRNLTAEAQAAEVARVKKAEAGMIVDPLTIGPADTLARARAIMQQEGISGLPVIEGDRLIGLLTNRDLRFERILDRPVRDAMTTQLVTAREHPLAKAHDSPSALSRTLHQVDEEVCVPEDPAHPQPSRRWRT